MEAFAFETKCVRLNDGFIHPRKVDRGFSLPTYTMSITFLTYLLDDGCGRTDDQGRL